MQQAPKSVLEITIRNPSLYTEGQHGAWRRRPFVGISTGENGNLYFVSNFQESCTILVFERHTRTVSEKFNLAVEGRQLQNVTKLGYSQSVREDFQAICDENGTLYNMHESKPILLDVWKNGSLKTIRLCNNDIDNCILGYTLDEDLLLFKSNPGRYLDTDFVYKVCLSKPENMEKLSNISGFRKEWRWRDVRTMAIATREWTKHYAEFKTTNMVATCSPTGQVFVYGRNFDTRDFFIANAALRPKETWRSMVSQAIEADPIKKATLREVNEFIGNTFRTTLSDDVFSDRIGKEEQNEEGAVAYNIMKDLLGKTELKAYAEKKENEKHHKNLKRARQKVPSQKNGKRVPTRREHEKLNIFSFDIF